MRRIWEKIRGRSGASMLFAILVFMLCVVAGTAALTAASANSGRYTHVRAEQQEYLSMASAVELMRDQLAGKTFTAGVRTVETETTEFGPGGVAGTPTTTTKTDWIDTSNPATYDGAFKDQLLELFKSYFLADVKDEGVTIDSSLGTASRDKLEDELTIDAGDTGIHKVKAKITVDNSDNATERPFKEYNITVVLTLDGAVSNDYVTTLSVRASTEGIKTSVSSNTVSNYDTTTGKLISTETTTTTDRTVEVTWLEENVLVTKGEPTT